MPTTRDRFLPRIEPLESRIAPAATFTFTDVDGLMATVTSSKGTSVQLEQVCKTVASGMGMQLQEIRLNELADVFAGTSLSVVKGTVTDADVVNVGYINATGISLGKVVIDGDLGQIDAGATSTVNTKLSDGTTPVTLEVARGPSVRGLTVGSMGALGTTTQAGGGSLLSTLVGKVTSLTVKGDFKDAQLQILGTTVDPEPMVSTRYDALGDIGNVVIGGSLLGGGTAYSGSINAKGDVGNIHVSGSILGGQGDNSGAIIGERQVGFVKIDGDLKGGVLTGPGTSDYAGRVFSGGLMGSVTIGGQLVGGDGIESGNVSSAFGIGSVTISYQTGVDSVIGGSGLRSGAVGTGGNIGKIVVNGNIKGGTGDSSGLIAATGSIASVRIDGDLIGGSNYQSGAIGSFKALGAVTVTGDIIGGGGQLSGVVVSATSIRSVAVDGSVYGGGGIESGAIGSGGTLGPITIGRDLVGGDELRSGAIVVGRNVERVTIGRDVIGGLGEASGSIFGYADLGVISIGRDLLGSDLKGAGSGDDAGSVNAGGRIKSVTVGRDVWGADGDGSGSIQSTLAMGAVKIGGSMTGGDGIFSGAIVSGSTLASVTITGYVTGGNGESSGSIETDGDGEEGNMGPVFIGGLLAGGDGLASGNIYSSGSLARLTVGGIHGGSNFGSGSVNSDLDMGPVVVNGDVIGSDADEAGKISTAGKLASLTINGSLRGGAGSFGTTAEDSAALGQIYSADEMGAVKITGDVLGNEGAFGAQIRASSIKSVTIDGNLTGVGAATASIVAEEGDLGPVKITGTFTAASANLPSQISAQDEIKSISVGALLGSNDGSGYITAGSKIGSLTVVDSAAYFEILAGYGVELNPKTGKASIGPVVIGTTGAGNWEAVDLVAGVQMGPTGSGGIGDGRFGTDDDSRIQPDLPSVPQIASVIIKGLVTSAIGSHHYGIVASKIGSVKIGGAALPLTSGNDIIHVESGGEPTDLTVFEVV